MSNTESRYTVITWPVPSAENHYCPEPVWQYIDASSPESAASQAQPGQQIDVYSPKILCVNSMRDTPVFSVAS